jgi:hypothetical protein
MIIKNFSRILLYFCVLLLIAGTAVQFKKTEKAKYNDFHVYYKTSQRIANKDWEHIYTRDDGAMPYRYVPYSLMEISWLAQYPEVLARKIWLIIQATCFTAGLYFLYLSLVELKSPWALQAVCFSFMMTFRYYIDSLYCGQVAGLIFFCFSLGLYFFLRKKSQSNGVANFFPTSLKIIPGLQLIHAFIKAPGFKHKLKLLLVCFTIFLVFNIGCYFWLMKFSPEIPTMDLFLNLWKKWLEITLADGDYFDGRTAKSQALRGVLLRVLGVGISTETVWKICFVLGLILVFINWSFKKGNTLYQDASSYTLGILSFIIFMPESLPYQIMKVIIPLAVLLSHPKIKTSKLYKLTVAGFIMFMSLPTSDLIGKANAEWVQAMSFPFVVITLLFCIMFQESWSNQAVKI